MVKLNFKLMIVQTILMGLTFASIMALLGFFLGEEFNSGLFVFHATFFGIFMGILFPLITKIATDRVLKKTIIELNNDEQFILEGASTLKSKSLSAGGKLVLTTKRLAFKPHKLNSKKTFVEIPLKEITRVKQQDTLGFIHNILIIQKADEEFKFYVSENERDVWITKINDSINN